MPTFGVAFGDILEVTFGQVYQGQRVMNVLHYVYDKPTFLTDGDAAVYDVIGKMAIDAGFIGDKIRDGQVDTLTWDFVRGVIVHPTRTRYIHRTLSLTGQQAGGAAPANVALRITKQGTVPGRGKAGGMSLSGVPLSYIANGAVSAAGLTYLDDVALKVKQKVANGTTADAWVPVLWSAANPSSYSVVADAFAQPTSRVVRRRTVGQGI